MADPGAITEAIKLLQPEGEAWRFSATGTTTDQSTFDANITWEDGVAQCTWADVQTKMDEAVAEINTVAATGQRRTAYQRTSDPIFFQEQRGEVEVGTWAASVAAIKAEYPK